MIDDPYAYIDNDLLKYEWPSSAAPDDSVDAHHTMRAVLRSKLAGVDSLAANVSYLTSYGDNINGADVVLTHAEQTSRFPHVQEAQWHFYEDGSSSLTTSFQHGENENSILFVTFSFAANGSMGRNIYISTISPQSASSSHIEDLSSTMIPLKLGEDTGTFSMKFTFTSPFSVSGIMAVNVYEHTFDVTILDSTQPFSVPLLRGIPRVVTPQLVIDLVKEALYADHFRRALAGGSPATA